MLLRQENSGALGSRGQVATINSQEYGGCGQQTGTESDLHRFHCGLVGFTVPRTDTGEVTDTNLVLVFHPLDVERSGECALSNQNGEVPSLFRLKPVQTPWNSRRGP